jgi:hypothetical protein
MSTSKGGWVDVEIETPTSNFLQKLELIKKLAFAKVER